MAKIKHKLFQVPVLSTGKVTEKYDSGVLRELNDFLDDISKTYINHTITTVSRNVIKNYIKDAVETEEVHNATSYQNAQHKQGVSFFRHTNVDKYVVISLVYKELEEDEIEEGVFGNEKVRLPNTKKSFVKPDVSSEADKYIKGEIDNSK